MKQTEMNLPRWDMMGVYPGLESPEFEAAFRSIIGSIDHLADLFDRYNVGYSEPAPVDQAGVEAFEAVTLAYNTLLDDLRTVSAYIRSFVATESQNSLAQARLSELQQHSVRLSKLSTRFTAWIGSLDVESLIERSELARSHAFRLRKTKLSASHLMSQQEEALAAELAVTGSSAWTKLHNNFTSQLLVPVELEGRRQQLPMSMVRNLAYNPDREVRRRAYEAELAAWREAAVPIAAALNSIKGETNTLSARRGWEAPLAMALFENNIDRPTLDAMMLAAREAFPDFRRYLRAKARLLGLPALAWYDLFAPVGKETRLWPFDEAAHFIVEQFGTFSAKLQEFGKRAFAERWIDAEPRAGKRDGAFCMSLRRDESRILMNYQPSFNAVRTLAHELGHAYHNLNLAARSPLQRLTPMTLAETASIFCETVVQQAALHNAGRGDQLIILETSLQSACQVVVDITSRFLFEQRVFEQRRRRELSVDEFNQLMLEAQRETYGDGLDPQALHPFMWASKPHYYSSTFYNFPYMFGLLFGLGLYARYQADPEAFKASYDELLSSTGMGEAAELAARFGIDIRTPDFWRSSLDIIRAHIDRFEVLAQQQTA
ncbi:MAG: oligoendopeptidase F [Herpetosiphonaceae bacterium]|nr:MAG: oligoendopeptidase F [Herpetosiphonaceae bacterium]